MKASSTGLKRTGAVLAALHQAAFHQTGQAAGQHVRRNLQALLEFVEAGQAIERIAQNQDAPPLAYLAQATCDRAGHLAKVGMFHVAS
jgi:hypothetical protein